VPSLCALEAEDGPQASLWKAAGSARRARRSANLTTWSMELVPSGTTTWLLGSRAFAGGDGSWDGPNTGAALVLHRPRACWAMQSTTADFASHRRPSSAPEHNTHGCRAAACACAVSRGVPVPVRGPPGATGRKSNGAAVTVN
jgi:hypothetical protein